jgi:hypothetical protein
VDYNTTTQMVDVDLGTRHEHLASRLCLVLTRPLQGGGPSTVSSLDAHGTCLSSGRQPTMSRIIHYLRTVESYIVYRMETYSDYQIYPQCVHHACAQINLVILLMLCRISQMQMPTNLQRISPTPCIWRMLQTHMHRKFRSLSHPFFIDQTNHPVQKKEITVVDELLELRTTILEFDRGTHFVDGVE